MNHKEKKNSFKEFNKGKEPSDYLKKRGMNSVKLSQLIGDTAELFTVKAGESAKKLLNNNKK
ncbi:MAG: hypothetical protein U9R32_05875 [Bacteroidota bacterium]|nr:hypothetical protein [Bacteroidota bacterium]